LIAETLQGISMLGVVNAPLSKGNLKFSYNENINKNVSAY
jgi:hypothetical protein